MRAACCQPDAGAHGVTRPSKVFLLCALSPGGTSDNSPAFQRREPISRHTSPEGTAGISRPFGTGLRSRPNPAVNCRAIFNGSFGTERYFAIQKLSCVRWAGRLYRSFLVPFTEGTCPI